MYLLTLLSGICCVFLLWRTQPKEREERYRKYRRLFHAALEDLNVFPHRTAQLAYISAMLGRNSRNCDIPIGNGEDADQTVSRVHALLEYTGGRWHIRPRKRRWNGTFPGFLRYIRNAQGYTQIFINNSGIPVAPHGESLRYGDIIQIGGQRLRLVESDENSTAFSTVLRETPKYVFLLILTETFLFLLQRYILQYTPENQAPYLRCMLLIAAVFASFEVLMISLGNRFHRFHCLCAAVTLSLSIGISYQHLFGSVGAKYFVFLIAFYIMAIVTAVVMNRFFWNAQNTGNDWKIFVALTIAIFALVMINILFGEAENPDSPEARLWVGPVQIGELLKPLLILMAAMSYRNAKRMVAYITAAVTVILMLLYLRDFGNAVILFAVWWVAVFILMDNRMVNGFIAVAAVVAFVFLLAKFPYALKRIMQCFHAMSPSASSTQQRDMILSVLFAGLRGLELENRGLITEAKLYGIQSDMALAGILAVFGLAFFIILFGTYMLLIRQSIQNRSVYPAAHLILTQVSVLVTCQILLNFCGSLDMLPFTGVVAPLVSTGGSSLLSFALLIGMMEASMNPAIPPKT